MVSVRLIHQYNVTIDNLKQWLKHHHSNLIKEAITDNILDIYISILKEYNKDNFNPEKTISNSVELVEILTDLKMDNDTLVASFLYPLINEQIIDINIIEEKFHPAITKLIKGTISMSQIEFLQQISKFNQTQLQNIRNMLLSLIDDYRSMIIKIAERISHLRNIDNFSQEEKTFIANQCMNIYAPLVNRLGIWQLKWEIEDLCFKILHYDEYKKIAKLLTSKRSERESYIESFSKNLEKNIKYNIKNIDSEIYGRPKSIYSIYRKMQKKNLKFEDIYDLLAIRILVDNIQQCYGVLGVVHTMFPHLPREFTDYIANPKTNGYQSIHTIIIGPETKSIELQIRTRKMHEEAELGIAAHWKYKENIIKNSGRDKIAWLRQLLSWNDDNDSNSHIDEIREQLFNDRVYIFTPRGEVVDLPKGATPLDFAYSIHSEIGHKCVCAKVNKKIVSFSYQLQNGDQVEIITQKNSTPSIDWLSNNFVKTSRAKSKIQAYFVKQDRDKHIQSGKIIIDGELSHFNFTLQQFQEKLFNKFKVNNNEDLFVLFGSGKIKLSTLHYFLESEKKLLDSDLSKVNKEIIQRIEQRKSKDKSNKNQYSNKQEVIIDGGNSIMYHFSRCCQPIPGDVICGFITKGRGVSIHRSDCIQLQRLTNDDPERIITVNWNKSNNNSKMRSKIKIVSHDYSGFLRDITSLFSHEKTNITSINSNNNSRNLLVDCVVEIEFNDTDTLYRIIEKLKTIKNVLSVERYHS